MMEDEEMTPHSNAGCRWLHDLPAEDLGLHFPRAAIMRATPQDALYHAEGDVWTHTLMVIEQCALIARPGQESLMRLSGLLHDVAKPQTTVEEFCPKEQRVRVRQPNHAAKGRDQAWRMLTDAGLDRQLKEDVCEIIAWHQRPTHLPDQKHIENRIMRYASLQQPWRPLLDFCRADNLGRIAPNVEETMGLLQLVEDEVVRVGDAVGFDLLDGRAMMGGARCRYLHAAYSNSIFHEPHVVEGQPRLHLFSGLPGSGKTRFRDNIGARAVSLDDTRAAYGRFRRGSGDEGRVVQECLAQLRRALASGDDVIWDATNVTRKSRAKLVSLAENYGAATTIWSFEDPAEICAVRNRERSDDAMVPGEIFDRMADKREFVSREEADEIRVVIDGKVLEMTPAGLGEVPGPA